jgi:hypothetical protein
VLTQIRYAISGKLAGYVEYFDYQYGLYLCFATGIEHPGTILEAWLLVGDKYERKDGVRRRNINELSRLSDMLIDKDKRTEAERDFIGIRKQLGFQKLDVNLHIIR